VKEKRNIPYLIVLSLLCIACQINLTAQTITTTTSRVQPSASDSTLVLQWLHKADTMMVWDSAYQYSEDALIISKQIDFQKGIIQALQKIAYLHKEKNNTALSLRFSLELLAYEEKEKDVNLYFKTLLDIGGIYEEEKLYDKAKAYYQRALNIPNYTYSNRDKLFIYELIGDNYSSLEKADSAWVFYNKILDLHELEGSDNGRMEAFQKMITLDLKNKNYERALTYNMRIFSYLEKKEDEANLATLCNNIGYNYNFLKDYKKAIEFFGYAEDLSEDKEYIDLSTLYTNMGITYNNVGDFNNTIRYLLKAEKKLDKNDLQGQDYLKHLIATIYLNNGDHYNALVYNNQVLENANKNNFLELLRDGYGTAATIYQGLYEYEKALDYYKKYLSLQDSFRLEERFRQQELLQQQFLLERSEKEIRLLMVNQEIKDLTINQLELEKEKLLLSSEKLLLNSEKLALEGAKKESELLVLKRDQQVREANLKNKGLEAERAQQELSIAQQKIQTQEQEREILTLQQKEKLQALELEKNVALEKERLNEISLLTKDKELLTKNQELSQLELKRQRQFQQFAYGVGGLLSLILLLILGGYIFVRRKSRQLAKQNKEIERQKIELEESHDLVEQERVKAENLLLNILPKSTAQELKETGVSTPRNYKKVTVLFTDFSGFTQITEGLSPQDLVAELNECFIAFDEILEKHNLEKIKTMGDAYMCAGGIPTPNDSNPLDAVDAAIEMSEFMYQRAAQKKAQGKPYWDMRIGINTGSVIAGVVGKNKFAYDIWGDTVNLASRMETTGEEGKINISESTYQYVKDEYNCIFRGEIEAKNKGAIKMYFVEGKK